jgi:hypothetical protein
MSVGGQFEFLPDLPDTIGVAGPFVGVHNGALIKPGIRTPRVQALRIIQGSEE